jgi:hypothetical protein
VVGRFLSFCLSFSNQCLRTTFAREGVSRKWEYELYVRAILHAFFCVLYFYP